MTAQPGVEVGRHGGGVADGGDAADDLSGVAAYEVGIGAGELAGADPFRVDYAYGFSSEIGAGPYERPPQAAPAPTHLVGDPAAAVGAIGTTGVGTIVIDNSLTYPSVTAVAGIHNVVVRARDQQRPLARHRGRGRGR